MYGTSYIPERKDMNDMSLVAMMVCKDGIVGFGDSKASRKDDNGCLYEDKDCGKIKKIFKNENMIIATSGNNEIIIDKNITYIETIINNILLSAKTPSEFSVRFFEESKEDGRTFQFIIGYINNDGNYAIQCMDIDGKGIYPKDEITSQRILVFQGDKKYCDILKQMRFEKYSMVQKAKKEIKQLLSHMIIIFDHYNEYNSVGKPVNVEIFQ